MPIMKKVVKIMIGEKEYKKLDAVSLSNNTVKRRIADMSNDVLQQIVHQVKKSPLNSIQLEDSTDIAGFPSFLCSFATSTLQLYQRISYFQSLKLHTKGEDIFQCLNSFFQSIQFHGIIVLEFASMAQQHVLASDRGQ